MTACMMGQVILSVVLIVVACTFGGMIVACLRHIAYLRHEKARGEDERSMMPQGPPHG